MNVTHNALIKNIINLLAALLLLITHTCALGNTSQDISRQEILSKKSNPCGCASGNISGLKSGKYPKKTLSQPLKKRLSKNKTQTIIPKYNPLNNADTQPPNDFCTDAILVEVGIPYYGTTNNATGDNTSGCSNSDNLDVWHIFTSAKSEVVVISLMGSDFDTTLAVYDQCDGTELKCNDDVGWELYSEITMRVDANSTYLLRVAGFDNETGDYELTITPVISADNDECADAIPVEIGIPYHGTTNNATGNITSSCGFFDELDVWHIFTPTQSEVVSISLAGSSFDTTLSVYDQCDGTELECNDDIGRSYQSEIIMPVDANSTYLLRISGFDNETGDYVLTILPVIPPEHDECVNAIPLQEETLWFGSTQYATGNDTSNCSDSDDRDVWHTFTPAKSGLFSIRTYANFDSTLAVSDECLGSELACNDDIDTCADSKISTYMNANTTYLIRVAGYGQTYGDYVIEIISNPLPVLNEPNNPYPADGTLDVPIDTILSWDNKIGHADKISDTRTSVSSEYTLKVIYGTDDRMEEYEVNNPAILEAGNATAVIVPLSALKQNIDGTFALFKQTLAEWFDSDSFLPLCPNEPYRDQPSPGFCSAFLVAPDIIATAGHCIECPSDGGNMAAVFGFVMLDETTPRLVISPQDVYFIQETIGMQYGRPDWGLMRLDRQVTGRTPLPIRRTGKINDNQPVAVIGYPLGIPRKYDLGGTVRDNTPYTFFQANLDAYGGNSGSVVLNLDTMTAEGILVRGAEDFMTDSMEGCYQSNVLPDDNEDWEHVTRITALSPLIPSYNIYLGTNPNQLKLVKSGSPSFRFKPESLQPLTTYYWQITVERSLEEIRGAIWEFRTGQ